MYDTADGFIPQECMKPVNDGIKHDKELPINRWRNSWYITKSSWCFASKPWKNHTGRHTFLTFFQIWDLKLKLWTRGINRHILWWLGCPIASKRIVFSGSMKLFSGLVSRIPRERGWIEPTPREISHKIWWILPQTITWNTMFATICHMKKKHRDFFWEERCFIESNLPLDWKTETLHRGPLRDEILIYAAHDSRQSGVMDGWWGVLERFKHPP